jgi:hypothetical protein
MDAPTRNGIDVPKWKALIQPLEPRGASEMKITTIGIDLVDADRKLTSLEG